MPPQNQPINISLKHFGSLITRSSKDLLTLESDNEKILHEFDQDNFSNISRFIDNITKMLTLIRTQIETYINSSEVQQIDLIKETVRKFFEEYLLCVGDADLESIFRAEFDGIFNNIQNVLTLEQREYKQLVRGNRPVYSLFQDLFKSNPSRNVKDLHNALIRLKLEDEEDVIKTNLYSLLDFIYHNAFTGKMRDINQYRTRIRDALDAFTKIFVQEFLVLFDINNYICITEYDIYHKLQSYIDNSHTSQEIRHQLIQIQNQFKDLFNEGLRLRKETMNRLEQAHNGLVTENRDFLRTNLDPNDDLRIMMDLMDLSLEVKCSTPNQCRVIGIGQIGKISVAGFNAEPGGVDDRHAETDIIIKLMRKNIRGFTKLKLYTGDMCCIQAIRTKKLVFENGKLGYSVIKKIGENKWKYHDKPGTEITFIPDGKENGFNLYNKYVGSHHDGKVYLQEGKRKGYFIIYQKYGGYFIPRGLIVDNGDETYILDGCSIMLCIYHIHEVVYIHFDTAYGGVINLMERGINAYFNEQGIHTNFDIPELHKVNLVRISNSDLITFFNQIKSNNVNFDLVRIQYRTLLRKLNYTPNQVQINHYLVA